MRIAVAGGTGIVGRQVVRSVSDHGYESVVLARSVGVDLISGDGVDQALTGVDAVIDVSNITTMNRDASVQFFTTVTKNLMAASERAGVNHLVALSIIGIDRVGFAYYQGKIAQEQVALAGPVPATVLRAAQFHEFAGQVLQRFRGPIAIVPRMRIQPVAAREVAFALVQLATAAPVGMAPELAGPKVEELPDLARQVLRARGKRRPVVPIKLPGDVGRAMLSGGLLPTEDKERGGQTFADWLQASPSA